MTEALSYFTVFCSGVTTGIFTCVAIYRKAVRNA